MPHQQMFLTCSLRHSLETWNCSLGPVKESSVKDKSPDCKEPRQNRGFMAVYILHTLNLSWYPCMHANMHVCMHAYMQAHMCKFYIPLSLVNKVHIFLQMKSAGTYLQMRTFLQITNLFTLPTDCTCFELTL